MVAVSSAALDTAGLSALCFELWGQGSEPLVGLFHQLTPAPLN